MDDPLYHFTAESNWPEIQEEGAILPTSRQLTPEDMFSEAGYGEFSSETEERLEEVREEVRERPEFWDRRFVCAAPEPQRWAEYGALHDLVPHLRGNSRQMVGIEIPEERIDSGYVVDMAPYSSRRFEEDLGRDPTDPFDDRLQDEEHDDTEYLVNRWMEVCLSVVPMEDYDGSYKAPEYWIDHPVDVESLDSYQVTGNDLLSLEPAGFTEA
ncbi:MAG: hypothetical protein SVQ76_02510 [Candidatus Nanohaloarchaea archaeon]|nr:hypothetical protein [Candidatus Nanohaloarchaea archaeon]